MNNALILGTFDGVHLGHRSVIESVKGHNIIAVTFRVPPKSVASGRENLLMQYEKKEKILRLSGVKKLAVLDFEQVKDVSHTDFIADMVKRFDPKAIACGFNFRFGKDAAGDSVFLEDFCKARGIRFFCSKSVGKDGQIISSSYIRSLIEGGSVEKANTLMAAGFGFSAPVINGDQRGRTLGFPTANQIYPKELVKAKFGVYQSSVIIDGKAYKSISNVGIRPTYKADRVTAETHILDFEGDLYGRVIELNLLKYLREEKKFSGADQLKAAIIKDINTMNKVDNV